MPKRKVKKLIIDFEKLNSEGNLFFYLDEKLDIAKNCGLFAVSSLYDLWDTFGYRDDADFFELRNYHKIKDKEFKEFVDKFISVLDDFKGIKDPITGEITVPNRNFDYKIVS